MAALRTAGAVALIDVRTHTFVRTLRTGGTPTEILIRPDGKVAYVSCDTNVAVIDLARMEVTGALKAGAGADGLC